jgi:hypothetical protein
VAGLTGAVKLIFMYFVHDGKRVDPGGKTRIDTRREGGGRRGIERERERETEREGQMKSNVSYRNFLLVECSEAAMLKRKGRSDRY